jgi:Ca-activated chloride channel family protein
MSGAPIALAKDAAERALRRLGPDDTFQVIQFSSNASALGAAPVAATPANIEKGVRYLRSLDGEGGTMMIEGIKAALDFPHDSRRLRVVSFMTDGYIGNEAEILAEMQRRLGAARVFSFGVGSAPNRYLLEHMAQLGNGAVAYVGLDEGAARAVDAFYERVSHPAMTDLFVDWGGADVSDVYPRRLPDLFVGRPVVLTGRYRGAAPSAVVVRGRVAGEERAMQVAGGGAGAENRHTAIAKVWARTKIDDLSHQSGADGATQRVVITTLALENGLMSDYTAFVAVDSSSDTGTTPPSQINIPVPVPEGVSHETTVTPDSHAAR